MGPKITTTTVAAIAFCAGTAVSFFTLPVWIAFAINVAREGSRTDWLSFLGSAMAVIVTLSAAVAAWVAVQRQIGLQQQIAAKQTALQQYAILQETIAFLQEEGRLVEQVKLFGETTKAFEANLRLEPFTNTNVRAMDQFLRERIDAIKTLEEEFNRAGKNRWIFPEARAARHEVRRQLLLMTAAMSAALATLSRMWAKYQKTTELEPDDLTRIKAIDFENTRRDVFASCSKFDQLLNPEIERVFKKMSFIRQNAGV